MNDSDMKVLEWVVRLAPSAMAEAADREGYVLAPNVCIMATKVGIQALAHFGIEAVPVTVNLVVGNRQWVDWMNHGMPKPMPTAAWSVAVHEQNTDGPGYNGHVMLRADDMLADLNFGQVSRPQKGMAFPASTAFPLDGKRMVEFEAGREIVYFGEDGEAVIIHHTPGRKSFQQAKDWTRHQKLPTSILIDAVQSVLDAEQSTE